MAQNRPPLPSLSSQNSEHDHYPVDPFADRNRAINFQDNSSAYDSTISLPQDFGERGGSDEKLPLTQAQEFAGGFYPPG